MTFGGTVKFNQPIFRDNTLLLYNPFSEKDASANQDVQDVYIQKSQGINYYSPPKHTINLKYPPPERGMPSISSHYVQAHQPQVRDDLRIKKMVEFMIMTKYQNCHFTESAKDFLSKYVFKYLMTFLLGSVQQFKYRTNAYILSGFENRYTITSIPYISSLNIRFEVTNLNRHFSNLGSMDNPYFENFSHYLPKVKQQRMFAGETVMTRENEDEQRTLHQSLITTSRKIGTLLPKMAIPSLADEIEKTKNMKTQTRNLPESQYIKSLKQNRLRWPTAMSERPEINTSDILKYVKETPISKHLCILLSYEKFAR